MKTPMPHLHSTQFKNPKCNPQAREFATKDDSRVTCRACQRTLRSRNKRKA